MTKNWQYKNIYWTHIFTATNIHSRRKQPTELWKEWPYTLNDAGKDWLHPKIEFRSGNCKLSSSWRLDLVLGPEDKYSKEALTGYATLASENSNNCQVQSMQCVSVRPPHPCNYPHAAMEKLRLTEGKEQAWYHAFRMSQHENPGATFTAPAGAAPLLTPAVPLESLGVNIPPNGWVLTIPVRNSGLEVRFELVPRGWELGP